MLCKRSIIRPYWPPWSLIDREFISTFTMPLAMFWRSGQDWWTSVHVFGSLTLDPLRRAIANEPSLDPLSVRCSSRRFSTGSSGECLSGLAIVGVIFLVIGTVCTSRMTPVSSFCWWSPLVFTDEDNLDHREICWLSYSSAVFIALGGLLLFTSHWTYSISSELQLPSIYIRYGYSTYLLVVAAVISLLSMSLVLWRLVSVDRARERDVDGLEQHR